MMNNPMASQGQHLPSFDALLNKYSSRIQEMRNKEEAKSSGEESTPPKLQWADEFEMPQPEAPNASFLEEVSVQDNVLKNRDDRFSGDPAQDSEAMQSYLMNDPSFQSYGPMMQELIDELSKQIQDGEISLQEAQEIFAEEMTTNFEQFFQ